MQFKALGLMIFISLLIGSFYNVVAIRSLNGENIALGRSHCMHCNENLSFIDMIPLISYLVFKGRCRYCKGQISFLYPLGELMTAVSFSILIIKNNGFSHQLVLNLILISILNILTITDLKEKILPNSILLIGLVFICLLRLIIMKEFINFFLEALLFTTVLLIIYFFSRGKLGGGDVKLYFLICMVRGLRASLNSLFYASWICILFIVIKSLIIRKICKDEIPFVPFINLGVLLTMIQ